MEPAELEARLQALPALGILRAAAREVRAYLVGGVVRDLLLDRARADLDLAVDGEIEPLLESLGGEAREHARFGTASVQLDGLEVDLAATRSETYAEPGALPDVRPAAIEEDLRRRDFSVNAMAIPLTGEAELIDPHGGGDDLEAGLLRVLHPGSFRDDPTRALRAARYAARLGFELEPETAELLAAADLGTVSRDRVETELRRIAAEPAAGRGFELAAGWSLIELPSGAPRLIASLDAILAEPGWTGFADRVEAIMLAIAAPDDSVRALAASNPAVPSEGVRLAAGLSSEQLALARALGAEWLDDYVRSWRGVGLEIDGDDLLAAGIAAGPGLGRGLQAALDSKLDGQISSRAAELETALEAARRPG